MPIFYAEVRYILMGKTFSLKLVPYTDGFNLPDIKVTMYEKRLNFSVISSTHLDCDVSLDLRTTSKQKSRASKS